MASQSDNLLIALEQVLTRLANNPFPHIPNPPGCKKRASVAIIIRFRPRHTTIPTSNTTAHPTALITSPISSLTAFFAQTWIQTGTPEILLIKRAGRSGDRWSGHVALPGGKRDSTDPSDFATAIRETLEEVGLDLSFPQALPAGSLPQRVVATTWGREPLMVLCPFLFVLTIQDVPSAQPNPGEVSAAHWVSLSVLLNESLRTREYVDTSTRMARQGGRVLSWVLRVLVGKMVFSAVQLVPSESVYEAEEVRAGVPDRKEGRVAELAYGALPFFGGPPRHKLSFQQPLLLWGLTLGVLADLLDELPPYNAVALWRYPTFTPPDLRFIVWLFTRRLRRSNAGEVSAGKGRRSAGQTATDAKTVAVAATVTEAEPRNLAALGRLRHENDVGIGGLGAKDAVGSLLAGYYERLEAAVGVFVAYRVAVASLFGYWVYKAWVKGQA